MDLNFAIFLIAVIAVVAIANDKKTAQKALDALKKIAGRK
jgi:hypothetical protein